MSQFSGNTNSDSEEDSSATEDPIQFTALCRTAHLPLQPSSVSSTPRPASSHQISSGFHQPGTGSQSRESGDRRIHSPWRGSTFAEGWYIKLVNPAIPKSKKTIKTLCDAFEETFIPKYIKDQACQTIYSLSMDQFNSDFDQYATAFRLTQAHSGVDLNNILVDALQ